MTYPLHQRPHSVSPPRLRRPAVLPTGLADLRDLPDTEFLALWDTILVEDAIKDQLLAQAIFNFTVRPRVSRASLPLHGIILLTGEPGTGKTSLSKGLAARTAEALGNIGAFRFLDVDPHVLTSGSLGKSQRAVTELFGTIAEYAAQGPIVVLLDEVETILADRAKLSLEANPVDVHRATDAALVQLDRLAAEQPNLLFVATSNFPQAIDAAFVSRTDLVLTVPPPNEAGCLAILRSTLEGMARAFPALGAVAHSPQLRGVAKACDGLDGRTVRKLVGAACTLSKDTALDPGRLTAAALLRAAELAASETVRAGARR